MRRLPSLVAVAAVLMILPGPASAQNGPGCRWDEPTHAALVYMSGDTTLARDDEGHILVNGARCGEATVTNTDQIHTAIWSTEYGTLTVALAPGPFAPGFSDEPGTSDEIEFVINSQRLPHGSSQGRIVVNGTEGPDNFRVGWDGVNMNADEVDGIDADINDGYPITMMGQGGDDTLSAAGGAGTGREPLSTEARGGPGNDHLIGGTDHDTQYGGPGDDLLDSGKGQDWLYGEDGNDLLVAGPATGDYGDSLNPGRGSDTIDGGGEYDTAQLGDADAPMIVDMSTGIAASENGDVDRFSGVESIGLSRHADQVTGSEGTDRVSLGAGDDSFHGAGGDDYAGGEDGNDELDMGPGHDTAAGGWGDDELTGGEGDDQLTGDRGMDSFDGGPGRDRGILGESRGAEIVLAEDRATFRDGSGEEPFTAIEDATGGTGVDLLVGDDGPNRLEGGSTTSGNSSGYGDLLRGGAGADVLVGGWSDYSQAPSGIEFTGGKLTNDGYGASDSVTTGIIGSEHDDRIDLSGTSWWGVGARLLGGDDTFIGTADTDTVDAGDGDDSVDGRAGGDRIKTTRGADRLTAGTQDSWPDVLQLGDAPGGATVDLAAGVAADDGFGTPDPVVTGFETIEGSTHDDVLTGTDAKELFDPRAGDDRVLAGGGDDALLGSPGADHFDGGAGRDDVDFYRDGRGIDVDLTSGIADHQDRDERDTLAGIESVHGTWGDDTIAGDDGPNTIDGEGGRDAIDGRAGDDSLRGGSASLARLEGGPGRDYIDGGGGGGASYAHSPAGIDANLETGAAQDGWGDTDRLAWVDDLVGSSHDDHIVGSWDNNEIHAGAGDDTISGAAAWDILDGGEGDDAILGQGGGDDVLGGPGNDSLDGGTEADRMDGGAGNDDVRGGDGGDTLAIRDSQSDAAACGADADRVVADEEALDTVDTDCETVERPPPPDDQGDGDDSPPEDDPPADESPPAGDNPSAEDDPPAEDDPAAEDNPPADENPPADDDPSVDEHRGDAGSQATATTGGGQDPSPAAHPAATPLPPPPPPATARDSRAPQIDARVLRRRQALRVRLNEAATVRLTVTRAASPSSRARRLTVLSRTLRAGTSTLSIRRVLRNNRGRMWLTIDAEDAAGNVSRPLRLRLR